jgi:hypothetical protein
MRFVGAVRSAHKKSPACDCQVSSHVGPTPQGTKPDASRGVPVLAGGGEAAAHRNQISPIPAEQ